MVVHCETGNNKHKIKMADNEFNSKSKFLKKSKKADIQTHRTDLKYKEIRRLLAKKQKQRNENTENIVNEL